MILDNVGMFELFEDGDLPCNLLLSYELAIHFLNCHLFAIEYVFTFIDFSEGALSDTIFLVEDIVSHLNFNFFIHSMSRVYE